MYASSLLNVILRKHVSTKKQVFVCTDLRSEVFQISALREIQAKAKIQSSPPPSSAIALALGQGLLCK